jgi:hypothetical protein
VGQDGAVAGNSGLAGRTILVRVWRASGGVRQRALEALGLSGFLAIQGNRSGERLKH